mmetsp:Transcript_12225/g.23740  ORF Transcript_12225/g.23740 Transcript_12225/m.23740 type:complete len:178 (+) Transcript_12225:328-861(+)
MVRLPASSRALDWAVLFIKPCHEVDPLLVDRSCGTDTNSQATAATWALLACGWLSVHAMHVAGTRYAVEIAAATLQLHRHAENLTTPNACICWVQSGMDEGNMNFLFRCDRDQLRRCIPEPRTSEGQLLTLDGDSNCDRDSLSKIYDGTFRRNNNFTDRSTEARHQHFDSKLPGLQL